MITPGCYSRSPPVDSWVVRSACAGAAVVFKPELPHQIAMLRYVFLVSMSFALALWCVASGAQEGESRQSGPVASHQFTLSPPERDGPIAVLFDFDLYDINHIDSVAETFELTGVMTLSWNDPREAFDPAVAGVSEKIFQGSYQFDEMAAGWYPQVVLLNEAGAYEKSGVQLRIKPDGTSILTEKITAVAEATLDMRSFPFDAHRLDAVFAVLGHSSDEVVLRVDASLRGAARSIRIPGWSFKGVGLSMPEQPETAAAGFGAAILSVDVARDARYIRRLITFPMLVIVLLSFSIFWMDKSSVGDRNSISFIGVLTGVAFQHIVVSVMPPVSYITLMHGFLFISFLVMAATVPINLVVARMDKRGDDDLGDLIDRRCRWAFPLTYLALIGATALVVLN
jgi:hypothetical protein